MRASNSGSRLARPRVHAYVWSAEKSVRLSKVTLTSECPATTTPQKARLSISIGNSRFMVALLHGARRDPRIRGARGAPRVTVLGDVPLAIVTKAANHR